MKNKHGGKRTGSGRKPKPDSEKVVKETVYIQPDLVDKFRDLGKSRWLNMMIRDSNFPYKGNGMSFEKLGKIAYEHAAYSTGCDQPWSEANQEKWNAAAQAVAEVVIAQARARILATIAVDGESADKLLLAVHNRVMDISKETAW